MASSVTRMGPFQACLRVRWHAEPVTTTPRIGVLALQGDVREHLTALTAAGADAVAVRRAEELTGLDGLVLPGGESTPMARLARVPLLYHPGAAWLYDTCSSSAIVESRTSGVAVGSANCGVSASRLRCAPLVALR